MFLSLYKDIYPLIFSYLDEKSVCNLKETCTHFNNETSPYIRSTFRCTLCKRLGLKKIQGKRVCRRCSRRLPKCSDCQAVYFDKSFLVIERTCIKYGCLKMTCSKESGGCKFLCSSCKKFFYSPDDGYATGSNSFVCDGCSPYIGLLIGITQTCFHK